MTLVCRFIALLPEDTVLSAVARAHQTRCLSCQAEAARDRGVARNLQSLGRETVRAPTAIHGRVMSRLGAQDALDPRRPLVLRLSLKYAAVAIAATATVAAVLAGLLKKRTPVA